MQGKRIGVISSIANNPNNDEEVNAKFAQAVADLQAAGEPLMLMFISGASVLGTFVVMHRRALVGPGCCVSAFAITEF